MQGCQIFLGTTYQNGKNTPKWPQNLPICRKIYQMAIKCTNKTIQNLPKMWFRVWFLATLKIWRQAILRSKRFYFWITRVHFRVHYSYMNFRIKIFGHSRPLRCSRQKKFDRIHFADKIREKIFFPSDQNHQERENFLGSSKKPGCPPLQTRTGPTANFHWQDLTILMV
jgi:hypothetical protein